MIVQPGPARPASLKPVLVLSLDGTPHSLLLERMKDRPRSPWHSLLAEAPLHRIHSSRPEVSSVAWASYLTASQPGEHGIFGFVEHASDPPGLVYPNGSDLRRPTLFERVHDAGGTVVSLNVPGTSPAKPLRGVNVGGFLLPRLEGNVQPPHLAPELARAGYIVDTDPALAHRDRGAFYDSLLSAHEARVDAGLRFAREIDWDLFHLHLMETDRLYHFYWGEPEWEERFHAFLDRVDEAVELFRGIARERGAAFVLLSDHGFTRARRIVFVNALLKLAGLLAFEPWKPPSFETIHPASRAWALAPGRIFLNLRGREARGGMMPGPEAERELDRIAGLLRDLKDPLTGEQVIEDVVRGRDLYQGPEAHRAADLVAFGREGIDLKADFNADAVFTTPHTLVGTHTWGNAFFHVSGAESPPWKDDSADVADAGAWVARLLGLDGSGGMRR